MPGPRIIGMDEPIQYTTTGHSGADFEAGRVGRPRGEPTPDGISPTDGREFATPVWREAGAWTAARNSDDPANSEGG